MAAGFGVIDMARIHGDVLAVVMPRFDGNKGPCVGESASAFLRESLSPFEVSNRGFKEASRALRHLNETLEQRNRQLATANQKLNREVTERRRAEIRLRESEEHCRELLDQARLMQENLRYLSSRVFDVQEEERRRISRELHDEVGQALTAVSVNLAVLKKITGKGRRSLENNIVDSQKLLEQTMDLVHDFSRELRPPMLDHLGVIPALRSFVRNFAQRTGLRVSVKTCPEVERLDIDQKMVLFRVAQESLTNVARHARASHGKVLVAEASNGIRMEISDDGRSFRVKKYFSPGRQKRLGLVGMQERVRLASGHFRVDSTPGKGTCVRVWIPFKRTEPVAPFISVGGEHTLV
jgi:signal transduction histidine kinase